MPYIVYVLVLQASRNFLIVVVVVILEIITSFFTFDLSTLSFVFYLSFLLLMDNSAPSISSIDVQNENENVLDQSTSSIIRYVAATTAPQFNQQSARVDTHDDLSQNNYDHQDKQTIARENQFDLDGKNTAARRKLKNFRMNAHLFGITCWLNVTNTVVSVWLIDYFRNPKRPTCLVIIGPTGTGKTSFALPLLDRVCYFKGRWCLNTCSDDARYLIFDDIPWDEFENRSFPSKKDLLSVNGAVAVTDKYHLTVTINVTMPSIVLLNPVDEDSLTVIPATEQEKRQAEYWAKRAVVYRMDSDEYFFKPKDPSAFSTSNATSDGQTCPHLGHDNEFIDDQHRWLATYARRRVAAAVINDGYRRYS
ncbi:unnamed protein product [Rotaria magnacalcarata]|nr:unnamed protein product [Rotaria magnacalcarata]